MSKRRKISRYLAASYAVVITGHIGKERLWAESRLILATVSGLLICIPRDYKSQKHRQNHTQFWVTYIFVNQQTHFTGECIIECIESDKANLVMSQHILFAQHTRHFDIDLLFMVFANFGQKFLYGWWHAIVGHDGYFIFVCFRNSLGNLQNISHQHSLSISIRELATYNFLQRQASFLLGVQSRSRVVKCPITCVSGYADGQ